MGGRGADATAEIETAVREVLWLNLGRDTTYPDRHFVTSFHTVPANEGYSALKQATATSVRIATCLIYMGIFSLHAVQPMQLK
jgi:hypothetical protein